MNAKSLMIALSVLVLSAPLVSAALLAAAPTTTTTSSDAPSGANKYSVAGSGVEYFGPTATDGPVAASTELMATSIKTSTTTDLIIQVTLECSIWTTVTTVGNEISEATATVKVWVEVDGIPVPVSADDAMDDAGKVVFCDRTHRQSVQDLDDEDARFETYQRTRSANAFNWIAVDFGGGSVPHSVVVKAELSGDASGTALAQAGVGHRTLVVEPVKLVKGDTV